jgi:hypothetical protein
VQAKQEQLRTAPAAARGGAAAVAPAVVAHDQPIPTPPDLKRHVIERLR